MAGQISVGGFEARLYNIKAAIGLVVREARVKGVNLIASLPTGDGMHQEGGAGQAPIQMLAPGSFEAFVDPRSLEVFLDERAPGGLRDFEVQFGEGKIYAKATATVIIPVRASAVCTLRIEDERQLFVDIQSVELMGVGAKGLVEGQLAKVNPVLDVADLPLEIRLKNVEIVNGAIHISGSIRP